MNQQSRFFTRIFLCCRQKYAVCCAVFLLVLLFLLSACTQNAGPSASQKQASGDVNSANLFPLRDPSFDPCALFSKNDAAHVLDGEVSMKADSVAPICRYDRSVNTTAKGPQGINGTSASRSVLVVSVGTGEDARQYLDLDRRSVSGQSQVQNVSSLGDAAFMVTFAAGKALIVNQGNTVLSLGVFYPSLPMATLQSALEQLAHSAMQVIAAGSRSLPAPKPHPCQLVTADEASQVLQSGSVKWFFTVNNAGSSDCDYISPQGMQHRVVIGLTTDTHVASSLYTNARRTMQKSQGHDIKDLGDAAFYDGQNTVWVLKGSNVLHLTPFGSSVLDASTLKLLHNAVARL